MWGDLYNHRDTRSLDTWSLNYEIVCLLLKPKLQLLPNTPAVPNLQESH